MGFYFILYTHFKRYWPKFFFLSVLGVISSILGGLGIGVVIPLLSFLIGGKVEARDTFTGYIIRIFSYLPYQLNIYTLLLTIIGIFVLRAAVLYMFNYSRARMVYHYKLENLDELFGGILHARWEFLLRQKGGHMQNSFLRDVDKSSDLLRAIPDFIFYAANIVVFFSASFLISSRITFLVIGGGLVSLLIFRPILTRLKRIAAELASYNREITQFISEHLGGIKSIKIGSSLQNVLEEGKERFAFWRELEFRSARATFLYKFLIEPMAVTFIALILLFSYKTPGFSIESFAAIIIFIQRIFSYVRGSQLVSNGFIESRPYTLELIRLQDELKKSKETGSGSRPFRFDEEISFENVSFGYQGRENIFSGLTFSIRRGEMVGLIGPSGAGKTSIADLLMRLFDPLEGRVILDGVDAREFDLVEWRKKIGYVSQDIFLLNDTIEKNIAFYRRDISEQELDNAVVRAHIGELRELRRGFHAGDRGVMLSGGQRQRVVLARVLAGKPTILILDEATSALDNESETLIQKAIQNLRGQVTIFVIAHRLSTIMNVDRLLVLDHGKILEEGRPQELLQNKNSYLYKMQHLKES